MPMTVQPQVLLAAGLGLVAGVVLSALWPRSEPPALAVVPPGSPRRPRKGLSSEADAGPAAVVVVDPVGSGKRLVEGLQQAGFQVVRVLSGALNPAAEAVAHVSRHALVTARGVHATLTHHGNVAADAMHLEELGLRPLAVLPGAFTGVALAEALADQLELPGNGASDAPGAPARARRSHAGQLEKLREAGIRTPRQCRCGRWEEVETFVRGLRMPRFRLVIKPDAKALSLDAPGVALCTSVPMVMDAFADARVETQDAPLCVQEFLPGPEFTLDMVSRNGRHKCTAIWVQHAAPLGQEDRAPPPALRLLETPGGEAEDELLRLAVGSLATLEVSFGPSQVQCRAALDTKDLVKAAQSAAVLDVTCCFHGGGASFYHLSDLGVGYDQITACIDLLSDEDDEAANSFHRLPERPRKLTRQVAEIVVPHPTIGALDEMLLLSHLRGLVSFVTVVRDGDDDETWADEAETFGRVCLAHPDAEQVESDIKRVVWPA